MEYLFYALAGLAGGMLGGMGMGGGTVLIPLLTILLGVPQHAAQAINLISFLPMAGVALIIHFKNGLVELCPRCCSRCWAVSSQKIPKGNCSDGFSAASLRFFRFFSFIPPSQTKNDLCRMSNKKSSFFVDYRRAREYFSG